MKYSAVIILSVLATVSAFAPSKSVSRNGFELNAEQLQSRRNFFSAASGTAVLLSPCIAKAMDQENVVTKTEQWETGLPPNEVYNDRMARYTNARNQNNSNFAPIKRLTLERKSPVTRLDLNAPNFDGYKKNYPGLFKN